MPRADKQAILSWEE